MVFNVSFLTPFSVGNTIHNYQDNFGCRFPFNFLPRIGDTIEIDGAYFKVLELTYSYKNQLDVDLYLKPLGDIDSFEHVICANS